MTEFTKQYAIRLPNGLLHAHKPSGWSIENGFIKYAEDPEAEAEPVIYDTQDEVEYALKAFQERAAHMGITEWLGRVETRWCSPFTNTEGTEGMLSDLEKFLEDQ